MKNALKSSDQVPPCFVPSSHRAKERCRGAIPRPPLNPEGRTADGVLGPALTGVQWYLLLCRLMPCSGISLDDSRTVDSN